MTKNLRNIISVTSRRLIQSDYTIILGESLRDMFNLWTDYTYNLVLGSLQLINCEAVYEKF
jgi:hypothetical protein